MTLPPFVLPQGVDLDLSDGQFSLNYAGDVQLDTVWGLRIGTLNVGGDLVVRIEETVTGTLRAGGKLILAGKVEADTLHGREVHLGKQEVRCRAISATEKIVIGPASLHVDVIIAPEIVLDPKASGKVRILEAHNDPGPTKIRGGYSLREFTEEYGDPNEFLAERGVGPLPPPPEAPATPRPRSPVPIPHRSIRRTPAPPHSRGSLTPKAAPTLPSVQRSVPPPEKQSPEPVYTEPASQPPEISAVGPRPLIPPAYTTPKVVEPEPEPLELDDPNEPLEPLEEDAAFQPQLEETLISLLSSYTADNSPPPLNPLREWVGGRRYERLRRELADLWYDVLQFHRDQGTVPPRRVVHGFKMMHHLVHLT